MYKILAQSVTFCRLSKNILVFFFSSQCSTYIYMRFWYLISVSHNVHISVPDVLSVQVLVLYEIELPYLCVVRTSVIIIVRDSFTVFAQFQQINTLHTCKRSVWASLSVFCMNFVAYLAVDRYQLLVLILIYIYLGVYIFPLMHDVCLHRLAAAVKILY